MLSILTPNGSDIWLCNVMYILYMCNVLYILCAYLSGGNNDDAWGCSHAAGNKNKTRINSSPLSAAYMRQWTGSASVQVMACRLFGAKPFPEVMLTYHQLDLHYNDVIMGVIASQITSLTIVFSTVYSDAAQRKHQSSASLAFVSTNGQ